MNKRLVKLVASFGLELPFIVHKVNVYDRKMDQIPYEERFNWIKRLLTRARKKANVNLLVTGLENLPEKQGYLITPNHQGMFDMVCLFDALDQPFKIIFKKELQDVKVLNKVLHFLEYPAIDRSNLRASVKVIRQVTKELKEGTNYVIFPEGTRSKQSNQTKEFKGGSYKA
ncbi:MAG: lysophospholipid acyltransferase family protein, partial [bacterium]